MTKNIFKVTLATAAVGALSFGCLSETETRATLESDVKHLGDKAENYAEKLQDEMHDSRQIASTRLKNLEGRWERVERRVKLEAENEYTELQSEIDDKMRSVNTRLDRATHKTRRAIIAEIDDLERDIAALEAKLDEG